MRWSPARVGLCATALAGLLLVGNVSAVDDPPADAVSSLEGGPGSRPLFSAAFDPPTTRLHVLLNMGDGQAFGAQAMDPTMARPEAFRDGDAEAAYRWQRPLLGYVAWVGSLGQAGLVPIALLLAGVLSVGALAWLVAREAQRRGANALLGLGVLVLPGVQATSLWAGPEPISAAAMLVGLGWWRAGRRSGAPWWWALAALGRETLVLVPLAVALRSLWRRDRRGAVVAIGPSVAVLGTWFTIVRWRSGHWPWEAGGGRLGLPGAGLAEAAGSWNSMDLMMAVMVALCAVAAVRLARAEERWVAWAHIGLAACMGPLVWGRWHDFGRPLLPLCVLGLSALASGSGPRPDQSATGASDPIPTGHPIEGTISAVASPASPR